jgi:hydroxyethylthiazole kinase
MKVSPDNIWLTIVEIRRKIPLVHNITNYVVMNYTANVLLALGASPVMAHAEEEVEDMVNIASALVINIGTLSRSWIKAMFKAAAQAEKRAIPVILDPVGAGSTGYRTKTARELMEFASPAIIRGNASEIIAILERKGSTKGVDSTTSSEIALDAAKQLNEILGSVICVSGETDYIVSKGDVTWIKNGHPLMSRVTGMGCSATALCAAFAAVNKNFALATAEAMAIMGIAGEMAAEQSLGPGSLQIHFLDALYRLTESDIKSRLKV